VRPSYKEHRSEHDSSPKLLDNFSWKLILGVNHWLLWEEFNFVSYGSVVIPYFSCTWGQSYRFSNNVVQKARRVWLRYVKYASSYTERWYMAWNVDLLEQQLFKSIFQHCAHLTKWELFSDFMQCDIHAKTASVFWWSQFLATDSEVRVLFPALPDFLRSSESGTASTPW
jgi:hypothetical protein